ncbi:MAG: DUF4296 domain-containing protein [Muribaculaceae bacterium]|nr:DUF4296 domain-containing protein [Muribaculaceae bacterium]
MVIRNDIFLKKLAEMLLLVSAFCGVSCSNRPKEILDEKEMINLMADLQIAEAYSNMQSYSSESDKERYALARSVLASHGVTQEQLDTTLSWYGRNLDEYVELYAKVDKELIKRRKRLMKEEQKDNSGNDGFNLWEFGKNGVISPLANSDGWIISIPYPELEKGERLKWNMHLSEHADLSAVLGVEYEDGSGETSMFNRTSNKGTELLLQTDTAKVVKRIYGWIRVKERNILPLFADSIRLERLPFDSLEYKGSRGQKRYSLQRRRNLLDDKKTEKKDSVNDAGIQSVSVSQNEASSESLPSAIKPAKERRKPGGEHLQNATNDNGELKWKPRT